MRNWLVAAGPVPVTTDSLPDENSQEKAFREEDISRIKVVNGTPLAPLFIKGKSLSWQAVTSGTDAVMFDDVLGEKGKDFVYAYALAEIKARKDTSVTLGIGSDDAIKVWHDGKLVHQNWVPRAVKKDDDLVVLKLKKGSNQLLLKVQDIQGGWGFMVRMLDQAALGDQLNSSVSSGRLDRINELLESGAEINSATTTGLKPLAVARLAGREEVVDLLLKKGATNDPLPTAETLVDALYMPLRNKEASGIALLVAKEGKIIYQKGFGYADIKHKQMVTPETKFRIGSVTKQFTAAAILKLQEQGLLSVTDKLSKYIPDFPQGEEVTIHQLLNHTSGIHSYTNKPGFAGQVAKPINEDSLIASIKKDPYDFTPGESFMYNNSGYFILGYIIRKVTGKPYGDFFRQTFFEPLGMKNTGVHVAGASLPNEALGYDNQNGKYVEALNWNMSWAGAAGSLYSTVGDLLKWNEALHGGKVVNEKSLQMATTVTPLKNGQKSSMNYGYGLAMNSYRGKKYIGHSGGLNGFISQLVYFPEEKLSIVMFSNSMNPEVAFDPNKIAEAFLWQEMEKQPSFKQVAIDPSRLKSFAGRYEFMGNGVMLITSEAERLYAQLSGQPRLEIFPFSDSEFFWKAVDANIRFVKGDGKEVTHALFTQNGQEINAKKLADDVILQLDSLLLEKYTGRYQYVNNIVVTITREKDRLFAQPTGEARLEMFPVSQSDFILKEINARLSFVKDERGEVDKIKLHMNNTDSELPKMK
jgi:CubicO group peptidase (beta-lactamase class C family)